MSKSNNPAAGRGRDPNRESYWRECLRRQSRSGLTVRGFCEREAIKETAFYFWRREIRHRDRRQTPASAFVEVHAAPMPAAVVTQLSSSKSAVEQAVPLERLLPGDRRLLIRAGCDGGLLQRVVSALASAGLPAPSLSKESNWEGR